MQLFILNYGVKLIVGFIGFGEVASALTKKLIEGEVEVMTSIKNRSENTKNLAESSGATFLDSYNELAESSDVLISAVTPSEAINVAKNYGTSSKGIFLDLNNISPMSTRIIADLFDKNNDNVSSNFLYPKKNSEKFVKGAIIGKVSSDNSIIYLSGPEASKLSFLSDSGLNIKIIGENVEKVAYIKTLRSIYTKGVTAITYEAFDFAKELGLSKELCESLTITEGDKFEDLAKSRMKSFDSSRDRKFQEMDEVLEFLTYLSNEKKFESNFKMIKATRDKFEK